MTSSLRDFEPLDLAPAADSDPAEGEERPVAAALRRVLMFDLSGRTHCAAIEEIREIIAVQPTTRLPGAQAWVRGLINLRGNLVTVLDASLCVYGEAVKSPFASILLVEHGSRVAGVIVDEVHDMGLLDRDVPQDALVDLGAMVRTALA